MIDDVILSLKGRIWGVVIAPLQGAERVDIYRRDSPDAITFVPFRDKVSLKAEAEARFQQYYASLNLDGRIEIPAIASHKDGRQEQIRFRIGL